MKRNFITIDKYQIDLGHKLGEGATAEVYLGYYAKFYAKDDQIKLNTTFAIKQIPINSNFQITQALLKQINLLRRINHPNIVQFIDAKKTKQYMYLIMEYCNQGTLEELIENSAANLLSQKSVISILGQILNAFQFLERKRIMHRDIKPKNILLSNGIAKLADFGLATIIHSSQNQFTGTLQYMSPQIIKQQQYTILADIWSLGITLYQMLFNKLPWINANPIKLLNQIHLKIKEGLFQNTKRDLHPALCNLIQRMLSTTQQNRISIKQIRSHQALYLFQHQNYQFSESQISVADITINKLQSSQVSSQQYEEIQEHGQKIRNSFMQICIISLNEKKCQSSKKAFKQVQYSIKQADFLFKLADKHLPKHRPILKQDLYIKSQLLLYKRCYIIIMSLYQMFSFQKNQQGIIYIQKQSFQQLLSKKELKVHVRKIRKKISELFQLYKERFYRSLSQFQNCRRNLTQFKLIYREEAYTQQAIVSVNLSRAIYDNFVQLYQTLYSILNPVLQSNIKEIKKTDIMFKYQIDLHFFYDLLVVLTFQSTMDARKGDFQRYQQKKKQMSCAQIWYRIKLGYLNRNKKK